MRLIDADELIEKIHIHQKITKEQAVGEIQDDEVRLYLALHIAEEFIKTIPSAVPDYSCDGCKTPKHICGICMRNYPNITDHYCTGEAWREAKDETD